jgi:adenylate cyclase
MIDGTPDSVSPFSGTSDDGARRFGPFPLRFNIAAVFTALVIATSAVEIGYLSAAGSRSVLDLADSLIERTSRSIIERTDAFFRPVGSAVSSLATLARDQESLARSGALRPMLVDILRAYPQLQSLYFAFHADGNFIQVFAVPPGSARYGPNDTAAPSGLAFAMRTLRRNRKVPTDEWVYLDAAGRELGREFAHRVTYDARKRPWYVASTQVDGLSWSDITIFTSTRLPGLTPSRPVHRDGRLVGAAAANVTLDRVSQFLRELEVGRHGTAFFMDREARLIAHPDAGKAVRQQDGGFIQARADEVGPPWVDEAVRMYRAGSRGRWQFEFSGARYLASFVDMPADIGKPWVIAIVVPVDDFVGELKRANRTLVLILVGATLVGVLLVSLFARMISKPITRMAGEADRIRGFELSGSLRIRSHITEIQLLGNALSAMKTAIQSFARFVPRELVRDLVASGQSSGVGGQNRHLSVMFTDIRNFSAIAERMPPHELMLHISEHFDLATQAVMATGGTVDKFVGDSVMAFWGAPNPVVDPEWRACTAALSIRAKMDELNAAWAMAGKPTLFVRIGVNADTVVVGNVGSPERLSYTAFGDGVVVAQRLEGINKVYGTQICISDALFREVGDRLVSRPLDRVTVKGRDAGLLIHELLGLREPAGGPLVATPEQAEIAEETRRAFGIYEGRRWAEALAAYERLAQRHPQDPLFAIFLERCRRFVESPPAADWDGVVTPPAPLQPRPSAGEGTPQR